MARGKRPTALSTKALAAFLTWKQYDVLLLLQQEGALPAWQLASFMDDIREYDKGHGGEFYISSTPASVGSTLRSLERRLLVKRTRHTQPHWTITPRGETAINFLADNITAGKR
jgi:DNA-binding MarR family transcriptional regulator